MRFTKFATIAGISAIALAVLGWTTPLMFPDLPGWVVQSMFFAALGALFACFAAFLLADTPRKEKSVGNAGNAPSDQRKGNFAGVNYGIQNYHEGPPTHRLTADEIDDIMRQLDPHKHRRIQVGATSDHDSQEEAERLKLILHQAGYNVAGFTFSWMPSVPMALPYEIDFNLREPNGPVLVNVTAMVKK